MLEGPSICHHFFPRDFPNVPRCIDWLSQWHELLPTRHGSAGGAVRVAYLIPNSCICHRSPKDAHTSLASFLQSSLPGTVDSSVHHSGVLHLSAFHGTHWLNSKTAGSRGISLPSSLEVSGNPLRKEATIGFSSGSSSKLEPLPLDPCSPGPVLGSAGWLGAGWSSNWTWQQLLFCPSLLHPQQSLLLDLALDSEWFQLQLSLSISSSRVATAASVFGGPHVPWPDFFLPSHLSFLCGGHHPQRNGTFRMGPWHGCRSLFLLTSLVVWEAGQHFLKYCWLPRRRPWQSMQLIAFQI